MTGRNPNNVALIQVKLKATLKLLLKKVEGAMNYARKEETGKEYKML